MLISSLPGGKGNLVASEDGIGSFFDWSILGSCLGVDGMDIVCYYIGLKNFLKMILQQFFIDLFNRNMGGGKGKRELQKLYTSALLAQVVYMDATLKEAIMDFYLKE